MEIKKIDRQKIFQDRIYVRTNRYCKGRNMMKTKFRFTLVIK